MNREIIGGKKKMTVFRKGKSAENPYLQLDKKAIRDERLSWKARGILAYLLALPDDWQIYEEELVKHTKDGLDSTRSGIKELINYGYIVREKKRNEKGKFLGYEYYVYEVSTESGFSNNGKSVYGKSNATDKVYTDKVSNISLDKSKDIKEEESFASLVKFYKVNTEKNMGEVLQARLENLYYMLNKNTALIKKAIELFVLYNGRSFKYLETIVLGFKKNNLTTVEQVENYIASRDKAQQAAIKAKKKKTKGNFNNFEQRNYNFKNLEDMLNGTIEYNPDGLYE